METPSPTRTDAHHALGVPGHGCDHRPAPSQALLPSMVLIGIINLCNASAGPICIRRESAARHQLFIAVRAMSFHIDLSTRLSASPFGWLGHDAIDYIARTSRTARLQVGAIVFREVESPDGCFLFL
jgi:hypothetical protein